MLRLSGHVALSAILGFLLLLPGILPAQAHRQLRLGKPNGQLSHEFVAVTAVRELADGRALISDPQDAGLVLADFARDATTIVGRKGRGPGEYQLPGPVYALGADSSFVEDLLRRRWLLLAADRIVRTVPPDDRGIVATRGIVLGADRLGHVQTVRSPTFVGRRRITLRDSSAILLIERATGRVDTVARVRRLPGEEIREVDSTGRAIRTGRLASDVLAGEEIAGLADDGWLAIARLDPFRVDWRRPDGTWIRGAALAVPEIPYTARERDALARRLNSAASQVERLVPPVDRRAALPPFQPGVVTLLTTPDNRLLIRRTPSAELAGSRYLIVDRRGSLDGELVLPVAASIVGFGVASVYVVENDEDDVQRLRRYAWPPG